MSQSRAMSMVEAIAGAVIGYIMAVATQFAVFPMFGLRVGIASNLGIEVVFTAVSIARSYFLRRFFERLRHAWP